MAIFPGTVRDLETKVRDSINRPRLHHALYSTDVKVFHVVCSALDVIGDTTMAIDAYRGLEESEYYSVSYLRLYGLLQALFIQQDAAEHIIDSLKINCAASRDDLLYVREIRNQAIAHPTKREARPKKSIPQSSHAIARNSLRHGSFTLMSYTEDDQCQFTHVNVGTLIAKQEAGIAAILSTAVRELRSREEEHRMKYRDQKLAALFVATIHYYIEKIYEGCHGSKDRRVLANLHVELLMETVAKFREALTERGILPAYDTVNQELEDTEYPLVELKKYFAGDASSTLNARSSSIFTFFVKHQIEKLQKTAESFDEEYERATPE
jgi:hypothetical protein